MEEIRRRDTQVFLQRLFSVRSFFILFVIGAGFAVPALVVGRGGLFASLVFGLVALAVTLVVLAVAAYRESLANRFYDRRLLDQWNHCEDRVARLRASLAEARKASLADLEELPKNVDRLAADIYVALRRADMVLHDLNRSEGKITAPRPVTLPTFPDKQAQDLLRLADRNIAEYNTHIQRLMGTVQRTEAQVMVFVTTLDTLRARMLNYRASGRTSDVDNREFLLAVQEARMQFDSIDKALEELDAPVASARLDTSPPPVPDSLRNRLSAPGPGTATEAHEEVQE